MTASLPIISQRPASLPQRPKLRLDTHQVRTFGKGSSLRLETLSAVSPTVRNTFSNAYEQPASAAPALSLPRPSRPQLSIHTSYKSASDSSTPNSASTLSSSLTSASNDSATIVIPYKQPHNLTSILSNSPARSLVPRKMAPARPLFPAEKKVSFRTPLEEEIKTVKYTLAHSDLESSSSTISSLSTTSSESEASEVSISIESTSSDAPSSPSVQSPSEQSSSAFSSLESSPRPRPPRTGDKRDSSESDSDSCPETPVAGRRKRRRDWRWTLGPLPSAKSSSSSSASDAASEDSN